MDIEKVKYNEIVTKVLNKCEGTYEGKMMSSPGVKYNDKVFIFYFKKEMTFRLGKDFNLADYGIKDIKLLNPFKNKPPLKGWFVISYDEHDKWEELAYKAYEFAKTL